MTTTIAEPKTRKSPVKKFKTEAERDARLEYLEREELRLLKIEEQHKNTHLWEYYKQFKWQSHVSSVLRHKMIVLAPAPNGIGKTTALVCEFSSWANGFESWNPVDAD